MVHFSLYQVLRPVGLIVPVPDKSVFVFDVEPVEGAFGVHAHLGYLALVFQFVSLFVTKYSQIGQGSLS